MMSPGFKNVDGVVREVNAWDRAGAALCEWWLAEINQLLFADDTALVADSEEKMSRLVSEFGRVCERRKLRVYDGKSSSSSGSRTDHLAHF